MFATLIKATAINGQLMAGRNCCCGGGGCWGCGGWGTGGMLQCVQLNQPALRLQPIDGQGLDRMCTWSKGRWGNQPWVQSWHVRTWTRYWNKAIIVSVLLDMMLQLYSGTHNPRSTPQSPAITQYHSTVWATTPQWYIQGQQHARTSVPNAPHH